MAELLLGKPLASQIKKELIQSRSSYGKLKLVSLAIAENGAVDAYVAMQEKWAKNLEIEYQHIRLSVNCSYREIKKIIFQCNEDNKITGILIHRPVPEKFNFYNLARLIHPDKDVEGIHPVNLGNILYKKAWLIPPTAQSAYELLKKTSSSIKGKNALIVGYTEILGKPLSVLLADDYATVTIAHIGTYQAGQLEACVRRSDIVISAVGKPNLIAGSWIKPNAVVIDVGMCEYNGQLTGDIEFSEAVKKAAFITPVPGGVGPLTVAFLFKNLFVAEDMKKQRKDG